ncbi:MAG: tRNA pseudouridine(13) synthase TruD [Planctomycetota bacterium]|jgi:tRNA pseudouridine13 synthase
MNDLPSPLPVGHVSDLSGASGIGGRIKVRPEDFLVEEIPAYEPCGEGEHLYLGIQKTGVSHGELLRVLEKHFGVSHRRIGYAGMKDKHAVTRQVVSIHLPEEPREVQPDHDRIAVLWARRHRNKLRRGHLTGNRFVIRIREVDPVHAPTALRVLRQLESRGMPAFYGEQRFGYRANNHRLGAMLLRRDHESAAHELCGSHGSWFPEYQRERRELFDAGRYAEAAELWTPADRSELITCRALARGVGWEEAIRSIGPVTLKFWTSALASAVFNRVLDARLADGTAGTLLEGDLAWKHQGRAIFPVTAAELADPDILRHRYEALELSPSGPLWGAGMPEAFGAVADLEREAVSAMDTTPEHLSTGPWRPDGSRRPFRDILEHPDVSGGFDDHGPYIKCVFDLRRGMYATMVLREIMRNDRHPGHADTDTDTDAERFADSAAGD